MTFYVACNHVVVTYLFNEILMSENRSFLRIYLLTVYINDLHCAIKYCKVYHFANENNLMNFKAFTKTLNK